LVDGVFPDRVASTEDYVHSKTSVWISFVVKRRQTRVDISLMMNKLAASPPSQEVQQLVRFQGRRGDVHSPNPLNASDASPQRFNVLKQPIAPPAQSKGPQKQQPHTGALMLTEPSPCSGYADTKQGNTGQIRRQTEWRERRRDGDGKNEPDRRHTKPLLAESLASVRSRHQNKEETPHHSRRYYSDEHHRRYCLEDEHPVIAHQGGRRDVEQLQPLLIARAHGLIP
jgi:hypothetical protein